MYMCLIVKKFPLAIRCHGGLSLYGNNSAFGVSPSVKAPSGTNPKGQYREAKQKEVEGPATQSHKILLTLVIQSYGQRMIGM